MERSDSSVLRRRRPAPFARTPLLGRLPTERNVVSAGNLRSLATPVLAAGASSGFIWNFFIASTVMLCQWWRWFWERCVRRIDFILEPVKQLQFWNQNYIPDAFDGGPIWWCISVPFIAAIRALSVLVDFVFPGDWEEVDFCFNAYLFSDDFSKTHCGNLTPRPAIIIVASLHVHEECYAMLCRFLWLLVFLIWQNIGNLMGVLGYCPMWLLSYVVWWDYLKACKLTLKHITAYAARPPDGSKKDFRFALSGVMFGTTIVYFAWCLGIDICRNLASFAHSLPLPPDFPMHDLDQAPPEIQAELLGSPQSLKRWGLLAVLPFALCGWCLLLTSLVHVIIWVAPCLQHYHSIPPSSFRMCVRCFKRREAVDEFRGFFDRGSCDVCVQKRARVRADRAVVSDSELTMLPFWRFERFAWYAGVPLAPVLGLLRHIASSICMSLVRGVTSLEIPGTLTLVLWLPVETFYGTFQDSEANRYFWQSYTSMWIDLVMAALLIIKLPSSSILFVPVRIVCCWWKPIANYALAIKDIAKFTSGRSTQPRYSLAYVLMKDNHSPFYGCFSLVLNLLQPPFYGCFCLVLNLLLYGLDLGWTDIVVRTFFLSHHEIWLLIVAVPTAMCMWTLLFISTS